MDGEDHVKLAYESILHGDYEQAIRAFEQAIEVDPANPVYHHKCSITCLRSARWDKALKHAYEAARLRPDAAEYRFHLASVEARIAAEDAKRELASADPDYEAVIMRLKTVLERDPLLDEAYLLLAAAYGAVGRYREAASSVKDALKLNPSHEEAKRLYAAYRRKERRHR